MTEQEIVKTISAKLKTQGFRKSSLNWVKSYDDISFVVNVQKSKVSV